MRTHEQMNTVSEPWREPETANLSMEEQEEQMMLMLLAYRETLHREGKEAEADSVNLADPEENELDIQTGAAIEWVKEKNGNSLSSMFRTYTREHPGEIIDFYSEVALKGLLDAIQSKETVH